MNPVLNLTPDDNYFSHWHDLLRQRTRARFILVGSLVSTLLLSILARNLFPIPQLFQGLVFLGIWSVHLLAACWPLTFRRRWPCPRCQQPFYVRNTWIRQPWERWPWPSRCVHCKLPEYAPNGQS